GLPGPRTGAGTRTRARRRQRRTSRPPARRRIRKTRLDAGRPMNTTAVLEFLSVEQQRFCSNRPRGSMTADEFAMLFDGLLEGLLQFVEDPDDVAALSRVMSAFSPPPE